MGGVGWRNRGARCGKWTQWGHGEWRGCMVSGELYVVRVHVEWRRGVMCREDAWRMVWGSLVSVKSCCVERVHGK